MTHQDHERLVDACTQVKDFNKVVRACCGDEILVLIEIHAEDIVGVCMNTLDVFSRSQIPYAAGLISGG